MAMKQRKEEREGGQALLQTSRIKELQQANLSPMRRGGLMGSRRPRRARKSGHPGEIRRR